MPKAVAEEGTDLTLRRSGRQRTSIKRFADEVSESSLAKRVRKSNTSKSSSSDDSSADNSSDEGQQQSSEEEENEEENDNDMQDDEEEEQKTPRKGRGKQATSNTKKSSPLKTVARTARKTSAKKRKGKGREGQTVVENNSNESALYAQILSSDTSLETTVLEWIESYKVDQSAALLDLINLILRSSGCKQEVNQVIFEDENEIGEVLESLEKELAKDTYADYPIISKQKIYKQFRSTLSEFFQKLFDHATTTHQPILFDDSFFQTLSNWLSSMSSSTYRQIRHTSTFIVLNIVSSLCKITTELTEEIEMLTRQAASDEKKRNKGKESKESPSRKKIDDKHGRKITLLEYITGIFNSVFVHRIRDTEPIIRSECIDFLSDWMINFSEHFLNSEYLRFLGFSLSDKSANVRISAVHALSELYASNTALVGGLRQFTERFKGRIIEMAVGEVDLTTRLASIHLITKVSKRNLLKDEDGAKVIPLIFEVQPKVRKAVASFTAEYIKVSEIEDRYNKVNNIIQASLPEGSRRKSGSKNKNQDVNENWVGWRAFASFYIKFRGDKLAGSSKNAMRKSSVAEMETGADELDLIGEIDRAGVVVDGAMSEAIDALWSELDLLKNWTSLSDYLVQDHSIKQASDTRSSRPVRESTNEIEAAYRLSDEEESVLLQIFVTILQVAIERAGDGAGKDKKKAEDKQKSVRDDISRHMINTLPTLFTKYTPDSSKIACVLQIPQLMNLELYPTMRSMKAFENLLDTIKSIFLKHSTREVLESAIRTLCTLITVEELIVSTEPKIVSLKEDVVRAVWDECADKDLSDRTRFSEDELHSLTGSLARLEKLVKITDCSDLLEEARGQRLLDIIGIISQRCLYGYREETRMIISSIDILSAYIIWQFFALEQSGNENIRNLIEATQSFKERREWVVSILSDLMNDPEVIEDIARKAFTELCQIYWINSSMLQTTCPSSMQDKCVEFVKKEIEKFAEHMDEADENESRSSSNSDNDDIAESSTKIKKNNANAKSKGKSSENDIPQVSSNRLITQPDGVNILSIISSFMRNIQHKTFDIQHSALPLAQYGRFGSELDDIIKQFTHYLSEQLGEGPEIQGRVLSVFRNALEKSFNLYMTGRHLSVDHTVNLARIFVQIIKKEKAIPILHVVNFHRECISYTISRAASYHENDNKSSEEKMLKFSKALRVLLAGTSLPVQSAYIMRSHINDILTKYQFKIPANSKEWDSYTAYIDGMAGTPQSGINTPSNLLSGRRRGPAMEIEDDPIEDPDSQLLSPLQRKTGPVKRMDLEEDEELVDTRLAARKRRALDDDGPSKRRKSASVEPNDKPDALETASALSTEEEGTVAVRQQSEEIVNKPDENERSSDEESSVSAEV